MNCLRRRKLIIILQALVVPVAVLFVPLRLGGSLPSIRRIGQTRHEFEPRKHTQRG